jgi:hypothetical protein
VKVAKKVRAQAAAQVLLAGVVTVASTAAIGLAGTQDISLTGVSATGGANTVLIDADATSIAAGVSATGGVNSVTTSGKANVTLGGAVSITTAQPLVAAVSGPIVSLTTLASTSAIGSMTVRPYARVFPTTVSASGGVGALRSQMPPVWTGVTPLEVATNTPIGTVVWTATDYVADPDNDPMTVTMAGTLPSGLSYSSTTKQITVTGSLTQGNTASVTFDASDGYSYGSADQDWIDRSTGQGVVWAHDFRYEQEFKQFHVSNGILPQDAARWSGTSYQGGNDPNKTLGLSTVSWVADSGLGAGGAVQFTVPAGLPTEAEDWSITGPTHTLTFWKRTAGAWAETNPTGFPAETGYTTTRSSEFLQYHNKVSTGGWNRPFSAIAAQFGSTGNGLPTPDPAASGTLTRRAWDSSNRNQDSNFTGGSYGHAAYQSLFPAAAWDGTDFWVQMRVKFSASRWTPQWNRGDGDVPPTFPGADAIYQPFGKLAWIDASGGTYSQELVLQSTPKQDHTVATGYFQMYTSQAGTTLSQEQLQPGADAPFTGTQTQALDPGSWPTSLWEWSNNEWDTVLIHIIPGRGNEPSEANTVVTAAYTPTLVGSTITFEVTPGTYQPHTNVAGALVGYQAYVVSGNGAVYHVTAHTMVGGRARITAVAHSGTPLAPTNGQFVQFGLYNGGLWPNLPRPYAEFGVQVWAARRGQTSYTKIWDKVDYNYVNYSHAPHPPAYNQVRLAAYMNNKPAQHAFTQSFTQVIFKKGNGGTNPNTDGIPCPQV